MGNEFYRVKDWAKYYETAETRKLKDLRWVPTPTKHDGRGLRRLLRLQDGLLLFGAWVLILQVAAKQPQRGLLVDQEGKPVTAEDLADIFGLESSFFERAFTALCDSKIGWLERIPELSGVPGSSPGITGPPTGYTGESPATPGRSPVVPAGSGKTSGTNRIEGNGIEGNGSVSVFEEGVSSSSHTDTPTNQSPKTHPPKSPAWHLDETYAPFVEAYRSAKPDVIEADFGEAHFPWKILDHEQKLSATAGVRRRVESGQWPGNNAHLVMKPSNYLSRPGEWTRPIIRATGQQTRKEAVMGRALEIAKEREQKLRKEQEHAG